MANTLTNLIGDIYVALVNVSREFVGFLPQVTRDATVERAAKGQLVTSFITPTVTTADITPGVTPPNDGDQVLGSMTVSITKSKYVPIKWNGEEQMALNGSTGAPYNRILVDQFQQAFRALVNEMEMDLALVAVNAASRAAGTAGTAPFGVAADLSDFALPAQILDENGASPLRSMIVNSASMANLRGKQSVLYKVNEAGTNETLRRGVVGEVTGFNIGYTAGLRPHVKGTGTGFLANSASLTVGTTAIPVDTGTGTILAGDVITFAGDTANKYVVATGVSGAGTVVINAPGLRNAVADNTAITVGNTYNPNVAFASDGLLLASRLPAAVVDRNGNSGDMADDRIVVADPFSGMSFEVSTYRMYRQVKMEVAAAWGVAAPNPAHIALLMG